MQAILMAGGEGTRLRPFTSVLPKPLVPIGDISVIEMLLKQLRYYGFQRVTIAVGYKAELIMAVIGDGRRFGLDIGYHLEDEPLGTVGALADMEDIEDNFLVMNGDVCTNMNFKDLYDAHIASRALATIGVYPRHERIELGVLDVDASGKRVIGFREKPTFDFLVSMGVNAFQKSIVSLIPRHRYFGFDMLMRKMLDENVDVRTFCFEGLWLDIGRPDDYERMISAFGANPSDYLPEGA